MKATMPIINGSSRFERGLKEIVAQSGQDEYALDYNGAG